VSVDDATVNERSETPFSLAETCKCACCTYWRRRVHRIAQSADKRTGRATRLVAGLKRERDELKRHCKNYVASITYYRGRVNELENSIRRPGLISRVLDRLC